MTPLLLAALLLAASPDPSLPVLDRQITRLPFPGLRAVRAAFPCDGCADLRAGFEVASYYETDSDQGWGLRQWAELYTVDLEGSYRRGRFAADASLALHRLDRSYVRPNSLIHSGPDEYVMILQSPAGVLYAPERGETGLGDLAVGATVAVTPPDRRVRLLARALAELPTGREEPGFGNGGLDLAVGARAEGAGPRWAWALAAGYVDVDRGEIFGGLRPRDHAVAEAVAAWAPFRKWSAALGVSWCGSPYAEPGLDPVGDDGMLLGTAVRYEPRPGRRLEWWLAEDPFPARGQPDFSSGLAWRVRFE